MKKYVLGIVAIGLTLILILVVNILKVQKENSTIFEDSGYILKSADEGTNQNIERYYFNGNSSYKKNYSGQITFQDTTGEKITTDDNSFVHYSNGSISALKNGVIINLNDIEAEPISYYNIKKNNILEKNGKDYVIYNLDKKLSFTNYIWKISNNKYIVAGNQMKISFSDGTQKTIDGYLELEYSDNEVVKIYNQEMTYQTVSSKVSLQLENNVEINVANKVVLKDKKIKMSLTDMVIDSEDNVELNNEEKYNEIANTLNQTNTVNTTNETNNGTENTNATQNDITNNTTTQNTNNISNTVNTTNTTNTTNSTEESSATQSGIITGGITGTDETNTTPTTTVNEEKTVVETATVVAPEFKVEDFTVDAISVTAKIKVEDEKSLLASDYNIKIIKNATGKTVYETDESLGSFDFEVNDSALLPDTEYTLVIKSSYKVEDFEYSKNFISKIFRTEASGISFKKDYFTNNSLKVAVTIDDDSKVKNAEIVLMKDEKEIQTFKVDASLKVNGSIPVEFTGLDSNTEYTVKIINILYDSQVITNGIDISSIYKTLKNKPEISGPTFEIDKRTAKFTLNIGNIVDSDNGISQLRYEVYDAREEAEDSTPTKVVNLAKKEQVILPVDDITIFRGVPYVFKVIAVFNDNEKTIEYESEYSDVMRMDGVSFPTVTFEEKEVTFERIEGNLIIQDDANTISLDNDNRFFITYTDSVGEVESFTSQGSLVIPVSINNLRANETYKFSIYTNVDLQDGNKAIDECYIGGAVVKTKIPIDLKANFTTNTSAVQNAFNVSLKLTNSKENQTELEASTLSGMTFTIYAGQTDTGTALRTIKVVDTNIEPYESNLKDSYYDSQVTITPEFFGAKNKDFRDKYYTIKVSDGYDYTKYPNALPITNNTITIQSNGNMPDYPTDVDHALEVNVVRNRDVETPREDLDESTIVGYDVTAGFDNSQKFAKQIIYKVYNALTNELVSTKTIDINSDGSVPSWRFDVSDGQTTADDSDGKMHRGNSYYFTYEAELDLNLDGNIDTHYPYNEDGEKVVLKAPSVSPVKQEAKFVVYPSTSTNTSITYKYTFADVDKTLETNKIVAIEGIEIKSNVDIIETKDLTEITFQNLTAGNLSLIVSQRISNNELYSSRILQSYYFEGQVGLTGIKYNVVLDSNKVTVRLLNADKLIDRITCLTLSFATADQTITKTFLKPTNQMVTVNLSDLVSMIGKQIKVEVLCYFDDGLIGYDIDTEYNTYQKGYSSGDIAYYYNISKQGVLSKNTTALGNMYKGVMSDNNLSLKNVINNLSASISLDYSQKGLLYQNEAVIPKKIESTKIESEGTDTINFDVIVPNITFTKNSSGKINFTSDLNTITYNATIKNDGNTDIQNDKIYVDIYKTDENGRNEQFLRTEEKLVSDFGKDITILDLTPKSYYYLQFRAKLIKTNSQIQESYLYDSDDQILGKKYYCSTLSNVGISNIYVTYNAKSYSQKSIDISYNLDKILGYDKIKYTIYKYNETTSSYELFLTDLYDTLFTASMTKQVDASPGTGYSFGSQYKVEIKPIAIYKDAITGEETEIDLGTQEKVFTLTKLRAPTIAISGSRTTNQINFRVSIYDKNRVTADDEYIVNFYDENGNDITPTSYKDIRFSTKIYNKLFTLTGIDKQKTYSLKVSLYADMYNTGEDYKTIQKTYKNTGISETGISVGTVSAIPNSTQRNKIDLVFTDSYKLNQLNQIVYTIYNINGYSTSGQEAFTPSETITDTGTYYTFPLDESLADQGKYYIELQFLQDGNLIETYSLEYTYIEE